MPDDSPRSCHVPVGATRLRLADPAVAAGARAVIEQGAAANDPHALFNLGYLNLHGIGGDQNFAAARDYFERAGRAGLPAAWNGIGVLHYHGQGTPQNYTAARCGPDFGDCHKSWPLGHCQWLVCACVGLCRPVYTCDRTGNARIEVCCHSFVMIDEQAVSV